MRGVGHFQVRVVEEELQLYNVLTRQNLMLTYQRWSLSPEIHKCIGKENGQRYHCHLTFTPQQNFIKGKVLHDIIGHNLLRVLHPHFFFVDLV